MAATAPARDAVRGRTARLSAPLDRWALIALAFVVLAPAPAQASRRLPMAGAMLAATQLSGGQNRCFKYSFDKNGNRLAKTNLAWGSATWGSAAYGCFKWSS